MSERPSTLKVSNSTPAKAETKSPAVVEAEVLVEDVSIDGMCGVY